MRTLSLFLRLVLETCYIGSSNWVPMQCLASIAVAAGPSFAPWAQPVFERCYAIVHDSLMQYARYQSNPQMEEPDKAFIVVALDLLSGLVQGHGMAIQPFIAQSNPPLLNLVAACLKVSTDSLGSTYIIAI